jgi:hypothetical protein
MKADYIKLSSNGVEATGRFVPHVIWSFLALRVVAMAVWTTLTLVAGTSGLPLIMRALSALRL